MEGSLKGFREHLGMTRKDFAERLGVDERTVEDWESKRTIGQASMDDVAYSKT